MPILGAILAPDDKQSSSSDAKKLLDLVYKSAGADNPITVRIRALDGNSAYSAGVSDGSSEMTKMAEILEPELHDHIKVIQMLQELHKGKDSLFVLVGKQNSFDPVVFDRYTHGRDFGASAVDKR